MKPIPETESAQDPTDIEFRPCVLVLHAAHPLGSLTGADDEPATPAVGGVRGWLGKLFAGRGGAVAAPTTRRQTVYLPATMLAEIEDSVRFAEESPAADEYFPYVMKGAQ